MTDSKKPTKAKAPEKVHPATTQEAALTNTGGSREAEAHGSSERPPRVSVGTQQTKLDALAAPYVRPGWHLTFQSSIPGNLERMQRGYYEFVTDEAGRKVSYPSGPNTVYLMQIEKRYYDEDRASLERINSARIIKQTAIKKGEYAPSAKNPAGGDSSITKERADPTA